MYKYLAPDLGIINSAPIYAIHTRCSVSQNQFLIVYMRLRILQIYFTILYGILTIYIHIFPFEVIWMPSN